MILLRRALFFSILIFCSCNNNESEKDDVKAKTKEKEIKEAKRLQALDIVSKQFNASATFDTSSYDMTYQYQNLLGKNDRVIISYFEIKDIEKVDSNFIVSITTNYQMFIDFTCTKSQLDNLFPDYLNNKPSNFQIDDKYLILKINTIKKIRLKIDSEGESNGEDAPTTYVEIEHPDEFICKGEFIDIYSKPTE